MFFFCLINIGFKVIQLRGSISGSGGICKTHPLHNIGLCTGPPGQAQPLAEPHESECLGWDGKEGSPEEIFHSFLLVLTSEGHSALACPPGHLPFPVYAYTLCPSIWKAHNLLLLPLALKIFTCSHPFAGICR